MNLFSRFWRPKEAPSATPVTDAGGDMTCANRTISNQMPLRRGPDSGELRRIVARERVEGGVDLRPLAAGSVIEARTKNSTYTIRLGEAGEIMLSGHAEHCPEPTAVLSVGSVLLTGAVCDGYLAPGMRMEFRVGARRVFTSRLTSVQVVGQ